LGRGRYAPSVQEPEFGYRLTDYDRSLVPSRFVAFLDDGVTEPEQWVARSGRSLGHPGWGWVYHSLLMLLDPGSENVLIETGTNLGTTTMILAQAIIDSGRPGHVHTIEIDPEIHREASHRFSIAGVEHVITTHLGDSLQVLGEITSSHDELTAVFLDGNHFHDHVISEFALVHPMLRRDGAVFFDNTSLIAEGSEDPRVHGALRTIVDRFGGNLVNFPFASWYTPGIAVWQQQPFVEMTPPPPGSFIPET
jgi:Methyltransferase domain